VWRADAHRVVLECVDGAVVELCQSVALPFPLTVPSAAIDPPSLPTRDRRRRPCRPPPNAGRGGSTAGSGSGSVGRRGRRPAPARKDSSTARPCSGRATVRRLADLFEAPTRWFGFNGSTTRTGCTSLMPGPQPLPPISAEGGA
jgi:hypothetical protein